MKRPLIDGIEQTIESVHVAELIVSALEPVEQRLKEACSPEIYATHRALNAASEGKAFRDAHRLVARDPEAIPYQIDHDQVLRSSQHIGGTGNLQLKELLETIEDSIQKITKSHSARVEAWRHLKGV